MVKEDKKDYLALYRTYLANERTLLAYWRTAATAIVVGAFFLKFGDQSLFFRVVPWVSIATGIILFFYGNKVYIGHKKEIDHNYYNNH